MDKKIFEQEKEYLNTVYDAIDKTRISNTIIIKQNKNAIQRFKNYFAENFYYIHKQDELDELADINLQIENLEKQNENLEKQNKRLLKQRKNAYFGRFDFQPNGANCPTKFYIGLGLVKGSVDGEEKKNLVYDWRADVCSLYYDDCIGETSYLCADGEIKGNLSLKRQFKIENGKLMYYIDSHLVIDDEILMEQLSKNATSKMHEIVSTIQKEQNVLIRANDFDNTIVQGVAGSGKTSVALHRVSFLLYKYRNELKSEDILILSPTAQFSQYIDEVLPSLGEEKSFTTTFADMARRLLGQDFESREQMLERVISNQNQNEFETLAVKSSFEFLDALKNFLEHDLCNLFMPKAFVFGKVNITKEELSDIYFNKLSSLEVHKRIELLADFISEKFDVPPSKRADLHKRAKQLLYQRFVTTDLLKIYNVFLGSVGLDEVQNIGSYDIAPILLIKENLFGLKNLYDAKYVIVDEMQDYCPCHFYLFDKIWQCGKLYLGDVNQSIDRTLAAGYLKELAKLTKSKVKILSKSYRSTMQISLFSQKILGHRVANNVNRNGDEVECIKTKNCASEIEQILKRIPQSQSVAVICKTQAQVKKLQKESEVLKKFKPLGKRGKKFITTPAEAKGVEFDCVIVPFATSKNYRSQLDRNLLYVCATRALHKLFFVSDGVASVFLRKQQKK